MTARDFLSGCAFILAFLLICTFAGWLSETVAPTAPATPTITRGDESPAWQAPHVSPTRADRSRALRRGIPAGHGTPRALASPADPAQRPLPPVLQAIRWCESRNDYRAENPHSTASGAWQVLDGTWNGYGGYRHAADAPRRIQDRKALALYLDRGTAPWAASRPCWEDR